MIDKDESLPYPYLPGYSGTYEDRLKMFKQRLKILRESLTELELEFNKDKDSLNLLPDLEKCQVIVNELISEAK